jgi:dihydrofolate reductase
MSKVTCDVGMSIDGYIAGPNQSLENPMGERAEHLLHRWMFEQPEANSDELKAITAAGAFIMGRNMFSPGRGAWDLGWTGWWGDEPPYHAPVFVLTHHPREPLTMQGGTTFHFVTGGVDAAFAQAREAAGGADVSVAGGASTVNQFLAAGLIDELRLHVAPVVLGAGERLFVDVGDLRFEPAGATSNELVTHLTYRLRP